MTRSAQIVLPSLVDFTLHLRFVTFILFGIFISQFYANTYLDKYVSSSMQFFQLDKHYTMSSTGTKE